MRVLNCLLRILSSFFGTQNSQAQILIQSLIIYRPAYPAPLDHALDFIGQSQRPQTNNSTIALDEI